MKKILCCMENHQVADLRSIQDYVKHGMGKKVRLLVETFRGNMFAIDELYVKSTTQDMAIALMHYLTESSNLECVKNEVGGYDISAKSTGKLEIKEGGWTNKIKVWATIPSLQCRILPENLLSYVEDNESVTFSIGKGEHLVCIGKKTFQIVKKRKMAKVELTQALGATPSFAWF